MLVTLRTCIFSSQKTFLGSIAQHILARSNHVAFCTAQRTRFHNSRAIILLLPSRSPEMHFPEPVQFFRSHISQDHPIEAFSHRNQILLSCCSIQNSTFNCPCTGSDPHRLVFSNVCAIIIIIRAHLRRRYAGLDTHSAYIMMGIDNASHSLLFPPPCGQLHIALFL